MDIGVLKEFLTIAEYDNFADAAKRLNCASTALRVRIAAFEESVGVPLLNRKAKGFSLTDAGWQLVYEGKEILEKYEEYIKKGRATAYQKYRSLSVAIPGLNPAPVLLNALRSFSRKYPWAYLHLKSDVECSLREDLMSGNVDVFFSFEEEPPHYEEFAVCPVYQPRSYVLLSENHPLARQKSVQLRQFEGYTTILYPRTNLPQLRMWQVNVKNDSSVQMYFYRNDSAKDYYSWLIAMDKGMMIYPWSGEALPPGIVAIPIADDHVRKLTMYAVYSPKTDNQMLQLFLDELFTAKKAGGEDKNR